MKTKKRRDTDGPKYRRPMPVRPDTAPVSQGTLDTEKQNVPVREDTDGARTTYVPGTIWHVRPGQPPTVRVGQHRPHNIVVRQYIW